MPLQAVARTIALLDTTTKPILAFTNPGDDGRYDVRLRTTDESVVLGGLTLTAGSTDYGYPLTANQDYEFDVFFQGGFDGNFYQLYATTTDPDGASIAVLLVPKF